jgi:hypothetical protein
MAGIQGTNIVAPVVPLDTADVHATHEALYGKGGYRTVATVSERDAIPAARREHGMLVFVTADGQRYQLGSDLTTWTKSTTSAHAATHSSGGSDQITVSPTQVIGTLSQGDLTTDLSILSNAVTNASSLTSGTVAAARLPVATTASSGVMIAGSGLGVSSGTVSVAYGTTSGTACQGNDARLSDARTPTAHTHAASAITSGTIDAERLPETVVQADSAGYVTSHQAISFVKTGGGGVYQLSGDGIFFADDSLQTTAFTGSAAGIVSGTIAAARLGSGTASASTYLRGDGAWSTISTYTLPSATTSTLGGVVVGTGVSVSSGTISVAYGTTSGTACQGNDSRLSDARTPTSHIHAASDITSGTLSDLRLSANARASVESFVHPFILGGL